MLEEHPLAKHLNRFVKDRIFFPSDSVAKKNNALPVEDMLLPLYCQGSTVDNLKDLSLNAKGLRAIKSQTINVLKCCINFSNPLVHECMQNILRFDSNNYSLCVVTGPAAERVKTTVDSYYAIHRKLFYKSMQLWLTYMSHSIDLELLKEFKAAFTHPRFHSCGCGVFPSYLSSDWTGFAFLSRLGGSLDSYIPVDSTTASLNIGLYVSKDVEWSSFQSVKLWLIPLEFLVRIDTDFSEMVRVITFNSLVARILKPVMDAY